MKRFGFILIAVALAVTGGCAARYRTVMVPPRIDLTEHEIIAVVQFNSSNEGELGPMVTRRFADLARRDQGLVRMKNVVLESGGRDITALKELAQRHGARTVLVGSLDVSDIRPNLSISKTLRSGTLTANVNAILTVDLIESATGASIWSTSARATRTVGHVSVFNGKDFTFDATDPEQAYGELIDALVTMATSDFRATWVREPIPR
jgi:hypothetical protein